MKATFNVPGGIKTLTQSPEISKYYNDYGTVYNDISEVNNQLPIGIRYIGLTVNINKEEYWYKNSIDDGDLVLKQTGGSQSVSGSGIINRIPVWNSINGLTNSVISDIGSILIDRSIDGDASYLILKGVSDGDNFGALEIAAANNSSRWQFASKSNKDFEFVHNDGTSWTTPFTIKNDGNVLIGVTDSTTDKLQVNGTIIASDYIKSNKGIYFGSLLQQSLYNNTNDISVIQNNNQLYSILEIKAPEGDPSTLDREATISLTRADDNGAEFLDLYNNGYSSNKQYGIRIQKRGIGEYRDFVIEYSTGISDITNVLRLNIDQITFSKPTIVNATMSATNIVKIGGLSTEVLMADGSVSSFNLQTITKTKAEIDALISANELIPGSNYKITGVHPDLYNDSNMVKKLYNMFGDIPVERGSGYVNGTYDDIPVIGGSGSGLIIDMTIFSGYADYWSVKNLGVGYSVGDILTINNIYLGGTGSGFSYTVTERDFFLFNETYLGTTIYLQALTTNTLTKNGHGEFWNPKYDQEVNGFGIWKNNLIETPNLSEIFSTTYANPSNVVIVDGIFYVLGSTNGRISRIFDNGTSENEWFIGSNTMSNIFYNYVTNEIYVTKNSENLVLKIDQTGTSFIDIPVGDLPQCCLFDNVGNTYVIHRDGLIIKIDLTNSQTTLVNVGNMINKSISSDDGYIYILFFDGSVIKLSMLDGSYIVFSSENISDAYDIALSTDNVIYVTTTSGTIIKIQQDNTQSTLIDLGTSFYLTDMCINSLNQIFVYEYNAKQIISVSIDGIFEVLDDIDYPTGFGSDKHLPFIGFNDQLFMTNYRNNSISKISLASTVGSTYEIGDKTIWGGYSWTNVNGNIGSNSDILNLDSEWTKNMYSETDYKKVYDIIEYDYENDLISRRYEIESGNDVIFNKQDMSFTGFGFNAISVFQFGNMFNDNILVGIGNIKVFHAYNENINFIGKFQKNLDFAMNSYQYNITFDIGSYQNNIKFGIGSYQDSLTFGLNSYQENLIFDAVAYQNLINFSDNSYQANITFGINSYQSNTTFGIGSYQSNITFVASSYQENLIFNIEAYQENLIFAAAARQYNMTLMDRSRQSDITFGINSCQCNFIFDIDMIQRAIEFENNTVINSETHAINYSSATLISEPFFKTIYSSPNETPRLRYFNIGDNLVIANITD